MLEHARRAIDTWSVGAPTSGTCTKRTRGRNRLLSCRARPTISRRSAGSGDPDCRGGKRWSAPGLPGATGRQRAGTGWRFPARSFGARSATAERRELPSRDRASLTRAPGRRGPESRPLTCARIAACPSSTSPSLVPGPRDSPPPSLLAGPPGGDRPARRRPADRREDPGHRRRPLQRHQRDVTRPRLLGRHRSHRQRAPLASRGRGRSLLRRASACASRGGDGKLFPDTTSHATVLDALLARAAAVGVDDLDTAPRRPRRAN